MKKINSRLIMAGNAVVLTAWLGLGCKPATEQSSVEPTPPSRSGELTVQAASPAPSSSEPMKTAAEISALETEANNGAAQAQFELGQIYFKGLGVSQDHAQAYHWCLKAAEQDHADAQIYVGVMNVEGLGVDQDYSEALRWYRRAAEQNHPKAQFNLGIMHDNGQGVPRDAKEAFQWFMKSAEQDLAKAQFNVGSMYDNGQGTEQDLVASYHWFNRAYENGFVPALEAREAVVQRMNPEQVAKIKAGQSDVLPE